MSLIIACASSLLLVTSLSLSSILSNMKMGSGGAYFLFSRILGIELGSALGILLSLMQVATISLCISGFAVSFVEFFPTLSIELIEIIALSSLVLLSTTRFALKTQMLVFLALLAGLISIFLGTSDSISHLPAGENATLPAFSFWMGFALFFPATTGIEAGMSLSGDLKNPSYSIPRGTLLSVLVAFALYISLTGFLSLVASPSLLKAHPTLVLHLAKSKPLVYAGVWGAILSSALSNILGAPRILASIAKDAVLPSFFSKEKRATLFVFALSLFLTLITDLNHLIPVLSMICLGSYAVINFVAFFEEFLHKPSWRPSFQLPWLLPLMGSLACFFSMFMINAGAAFLVIALTVGLCLWTSTRKVEGNWDDIRHSLFSFLIQKATTKLSHLQPNPKSWRPHILTLLATPRLEHNLAYFAYALDQDKGFLTFATSSEQKDGYKNLLEQIQALSIHAHVHINPSENTEESCEQIIKNYGFGPLRPNTILLSLASFPLKHLYLLLEHAAIFEKNILILKDDPKNGALYAKSGDTPKTIHLWWRGLNQRNFQLCLALSYILQCSPQWSGANIIIKSLVKDQIAQDKLISIFSKAKQHLRIKHIDFAPILAPAQDFFLQLREDAKEADFTFLGLRMPDEKKGYEDYLSKVFLETENLHNIAFVLSGEDLKFEEIFN